MKTGSSALLVWLAENVMALREKGVDYPLTLGRPEHAYHITSGNGQEAIAALKCGQGRAYFSTLCTSAAPKVLLSTEMFQDLGYEEISGLREVLESLEVEVTVIAFVRDIYEYIFSLYGQGVKRHLECRTFREYALDPDLKIGELDALDAWARYFDDVRVLHYDSLKDRLDTAFLEAIGLQSGDAAAMPATRVNRSLTLEEL